LRTQTKLSLSLAVLIGLAGVVQTGCVIRARAGVAAPAPNMVMVDGVWVVEDYDQPVFYDSGFYWWYSGGLWYRSTYYNGGWVRVSTVPVRIRTIRQPRRYVRYRSSRPAQRRSVNAYRRDRRDARMDRRQDRRDVRQNRRDVRQDRRQNRRDARQDRRQDRRDTRQERRDNRRDRREDRREERRENRRDRRH